jgi:hypothetical protein
MVEGEVIIVSFHRQMPVLKMYKLCLRGQASTLAHVAQLLAEVQKCLKDAPVNSFIRLLLDPVSISIGVPHQVRGAIIHLQETKHLRTHFGLIPLIENWSIPVRPTSSVGVGPNAAGV